MEPLLEHSKIVLKLSLSAYAEVDDFFWGESDALLEKRELSKRETRTKGLLCI